MILLICFIFHLQMLYHLIRWKRIDDMFVIVYVLVRNIPIINLKYRLQGMAHDTCTFGWNILIYGKLPKYLQA
jgi:hypothetical protein